MLQQQFATDAQAEMPAGSTLRAGVFAKQIWVPRARWAG